VVLRQFRFQGLQQRIAAQIVVVGGVFVGVFLLDGAEVRSLS